MGLINVYVQTNDTDVVVLLVAFMLDFLKINAGAQMIAIYGVGTHKYNMSISVIAESITLERCKEFSYSTSYSFDVYRDQIIRQVFSLFEK